MAPQDPPSLPGDWERRLADEVVTPLEPARATSIAAAAAAASTAGGIAATALTAATVVKVTAAVAAAITVGGAVAAAAGILPDPLQGWVADLVDGIGISLPRPEEVLPTVPAVTVPEITLPGVTVPTIPVPGLP